MTHIERLQQRGIRRLRKGKNGFQYRTVDGGKVRKADLFRIEAMRIPPAWKSVAINPAVNGRVQAIGKDAAGRWQYIYHVDHVKKQERQKFDRLVKFGESLPALRRTIAKDLRQSWLSRERVLACMLKILTLSFLRPGSDIYANEHGSYGIATLQSKHVSIKGDRVVFDFKGKSGVQQHRELRNRPVARVVKELLELSGRRVFQYKNDDDSLVKVKPAHINAYIKETMGASFTAKDFRTWAGTLICASALARSSASEDESSNIRKRVQRALVETAEELGNTPAVCRSAYVCPAVLSGFDKGRVVRRYFATVDELTSYRGTLLHPAEKALLQFLNTQTQVRSAKPKNLFLQ